MTAHHNSRPTTPLQREPGEARPVEPGPVDQLAAFKGLETAVHEIHYLSVLMVKFEEVETTGNRNADGTYSCHYQSYDDANIHSFLGHEVERRANALRRDFLACFELAHCSGHS